jgi:hypothetical protein
LEGESEVDEENETKINVMNDANNTSSINRNSNSVLIRIVDEEEQADHHEHGN